MRDPNQPVTILLCALGGEGGGVLADWLVHTARLCGHAVQGTSIPGVAQRTGATTYYVEIFPRPLIELGGRQPVFGLYAVPGALDLMVGSELLEAARQAGNGLVSPDRTAVLASSARALTTNEKMQMGDGRFADDQLLAVLRQTANELEVFDMATLAQQHGTVISAVMLGALGAWCQAGGLLPFPRAAYEATIRQGGKGVEPSLRGFGAAWDRVAAARAQRDAALGLAAEVTAELVAGLMAGLSNEQAPPVLPAAAAARFPAVLHPMLALGHARLLAYQDAAYAELYLQRLARLLAAEQAAGAPEAPATLEASRWLALWMAFDDIVRVAELKSRAGRFARVRQETKAAPDELLRLHEHFKPGVPEVAALLPKGLANALQRWDARRVQRGLAPFALPLKIGTHTVLGLLALRLLAGLKGQRRRGSRFAVEQALIERWLAAIEASLPDPSARAGNQAGAASLGLEIARCGQLIKGYGSTNERGKHNLLHVIDHLATSANATHVGDAAARALAVAAARKAALADEGGTALDLALKAHGAPARPLVAQPIRWHRRRPETSAPP